MGIDPKTIIERPDGSTIEFGKLKVRDQLAHEFVAANIPAAESLKELIAGFKLKVVAELMAHRDMMLRDYGVQVGGKGGNITLKTADGKMAVKFTVQKFIEFGPELEAAKALIFECMNEWSEDAGAEIREIVAQVFQLNKNGRIDTQGILGLRKLAITDERWVKAMAAIDDAIRTDREASYLNFYLIDPATGAETRIPLDIAKV